MNLPRVYPILDTQALAARGCDPETAAQAWLDGGAGILQFRHKVPAGAVAPGPRAAVAPGPPGAVAPRPPGAVAPRPPGAVSPRWSRPVFDLAERIAGWCAERGAMFVVNDRADMAMLLAAGLHVGQDDLPPDDARRLLGTHAVIGFSTHNPGQLDAAAAEPVDYVALGPIFRTASKENPDPVVGLDALQKCRARCGRPMVAIGGITRETARDVFAAGADSIAVIGDLLPEECTSANLRRRMEEWQQLART